MTIIAMSLFIQLSQASAGQPDAVARGEKVFTQNCVACHGARGDGRGPASAAIKGAKPRNFLEEDFKYGAKPDEIFATITKGVPGTAMPSWADLSEGDRRDVIAFVLSLKKR